MGDQRGRVEPAASDQVHQPTHPLLATGAQGGHDPMVAESCRERGVRHLELAGVDPEARQRAARPKDAECRLECLLRSERLDRDVRTTAGRQPADLVEHVHAGVVEHDVGTHPAGHRLTCRVALDADDQARAHQTRAGRGAQSDRALGEDDDRIAESNAAGFGTGEARRRDIGQEDDLLVGQVLGDLREVRLGVRHDEELGLRAVDRVPEAPAAERLEPGAMAALRQPARQAGVALAARRDRADQNTLADLVADEARPELFDHPDGLVTQDEARPNRVFAFDDVDVRPADRGERDPDECLARAGMASCDLLDPDVVGPVEDRGPHRVDRNHR